MNLLLNRTCDACSPSVSDFTSLTSEALYGLNMLMALFRLQDTPLSRGGSLREELQALAQ